MHAVNANMRVPMTSLFFSKVESPIETNTCLDSARNSPAIHPWLKHNCMGISGEDGEGRDTLPLKMARHDRPLNGRHMSSVRFLHPS
jgi:hypothetical protein